MTTIIRPSGKAKLIHVVDEAWADNDGILVRALCGRNTKGTIDADADVSEVSCSQCGKAIARVYTGPSVDLTVRDVIVGDGAIDNKLAADALREMLRREMLDEVGEAPDSLEDETAKAIEVMNACTPATPSPVLYQPEPATAPVFSSPETVREPRPERHRTAGQKRHGMVRYQRGLKRRAMKEAARNAK